MFYNSGRQLPKEEESILPCLLEHYKLFSLIPVHESQEKHTLKTVSNGELYSFVATHYRTTIQDNWVSIVGGYGLGGLE
jgi:hypothetical protein